MYLHHARRDGSRVFLRAAAEPLRTEKEYSLNIRTMKELLKLWKADCEAEGFSNEDYIVAFKVVVLFSIFLAIL